MSALELVSKQQLAGAAKILAQSFELVQRRSTTFIPVDWQSFSPDPPPPIGKRVWIPFTPDDMIELANIKSGILFATDGEFQSFVFMLQQFAERDLGDSDSILIRTKTGLKVLNSEGNLVDHDGTFIPNFVKPMLNESEEDKAEVFNTIAEWLDSEEEAHSLLHHLATSLAPGYSAVKYVILLGDGRNGKGVLLGMISRLFGKENYSSVPRQEMATGSSTTIQLNDKLLNVIFDGKMEYIKDSSNEKTLIAGEPLWVRPLYKSSSVEVQTNALFIEALNLEPKARDKSSALQKRLARFWFPKVFGQDKKFSRHMWSEKMLGAFLALLIDHWVGEDEIDEKLLLSGTSLKLQAEQQWLGSPVLQFIDHVLQVEPDFVDKLNKGDYLQETFIQGFKPWLSTQGQGRDEGDLQTMLKGTFELGWKTKRVDGKPTNNRVIKAIKPDSLAVLEQMKGDPADADAAVEEELVGDEFL